MSHLWKKKALKCWMLQWSLSWPKLYKLCWPCHWGLRFIFNVMKSHKNVIKQKKFISILTWNDGHLFNESLHSTNGLDVFVFLNLDIKWWIKHQIHWNRKICPSLWALHGFAGQSHYGCEVKNACNYSSTFPKTVNATSKAIIWNVVYDLFEIEIRILS